MQILDWLTTVHPLPSQGVIFGTCLSALALVFINGLWQVARNGITIVHEGGHAFAALLSGRKLKGIKLHSDTSGVTISAGSPAGLGWFFTLLAGYTAPSLLGLAFAAMLAAGYVTLLLWLYTALLAAIFLMSRNIYGLLLTLVTAGALFWVSWHVASEGREFFAYAFTWFLLIGGVRPVSELQRKRWSGAGKDSDADKLAALTGVPGIVWVGIFGIVTLGSLIVGGHWLLAEIVDFKPLLEAIKAIDLTPLGEFITKVTS